MQGLASGDSKGITQTEDILNRILPPREWTQEGQLWIQYVSATPATRLDVINLQEKLDQQLQQRQARETGICPVREELYAQCFDELIREVTINCAERGLLLLRVRDEMRMTVAAYQTLYESAVAFGMRKALQTEQGKSELESRVQVRALPLLLNTTYLATTCLCMCRLRTPRAARVRGAHAQCNTLLRCIGTNTLSQMLPTQSQQQQTRSQQPARHAAPRGREGRPGAQCGGAQDEVRGGGGARARAPRG